MTKHEGGRYHDGKLFLPWYTSPCLEWLMTLDLKRKKIFEYGTGDSTKWYRSKDAYVRGVESDPVWARETSAIHETDRKRYIETPMFCGGSFPAIHDFTNRWDIIIIDGLYRDECTEIALKTLKTGGYLIIDNFHQPSVQEHWPLTDKLIEGMPITIYKEPTHADWQTAVITKPV